MKSKLIQIISILAFASGISPAFAQITRSIPSIDFVQDGTLGPDGVWSGSTELSSWCGVTTEPETKDTTSSGEHNSNCHQLEWKTAGKYSITIVRKVLSENQTHSNGSLSGTFDTTSKDQTVTHENGRKEVFDQISTKIINAYETGLTSFKTSKQSTLPEVQSEWNSYKSTLKNALITGATVAKYSGSLSASNYFDGKACPQNVVSGKWRHVITDGNWLAPYAEELGQLSISPDPIFAEQLAKFPKADCPCCDGDSATSSSGCE